MGSYHGDLLLEMRGTNKDMLLGSLTEKHSKQPQGTRLHSATLRT